MLDVNDMSCEKCQLLYGLIPLKIRKIVKGI